MTNNDATSCQNNSQGHIARDYHSHTIITLFAVGLAAMRINDISQAPTDIIVATE